MSQDWQTKARQFAEFVAAMPPEEKELQLEKDRARVIAEHREFQEAFQNGNCYLCSQPLASFAEASPCAHWLLNPPGFRKRHLPLVTAKYGYHRIQNFLRWIANEDGFARNINDMPEEGSGKMLEVTIRYKTLEWSFSCTENDFQGHGSGLHQNPHYHLQMREGPRMLVRFNDFHIPFTEYDVVTIVAEREHPDKFKRQYLHGEGMSAIMDDAVVEKLLEHSSSADEPELAEFKFDTILQADEGTTMRGEDIQALIDEARAKGVSIASLIKKRGIPNARATTIVTPGPGVVEQSIRSGRGKKKSGD